MGVGSEGVAEFLDAAPVIDDDTRPRPSPSARRGDWGKRRSPAGSDLNPVGMADC